VINPQLAARGALVEDHVELIVIGVVAHKVEETLELRIERHPVDDGIADTYGRRNRRQSLIARQPCASNMSPNALADLLGEAAEEHG
jgi:hypothetical protein